MTQVTTHISPAEARKKQWMELFFTIFLTLILAGVIYGVMNDYWTARDIWNTSIEKEVMVLGKRKGGGKIPNIVYVKDGIIPVGVKAGTRWYWQCEKGKPAKVRFSLKHHAYQDPYIKLDRSKYFAWFFGLLMIFCLGQLISIMKKIAKPAAPE